jgi:spermidine synthase
LTDAARDRGPAHAADLKTCATADPAGLKTCGTNETPRRFLVALLLLFVASGSAALVYEIVWFQLLQLVIGSSAISLGILLATFMGGMCLGSYLFPRLVPARLHPLRVYAVLEAGIGTLAILILVSMPVVGGMYTAWAGSGIVGIVVRAGAAGVCLLPPTVLMGATLPAVSRWVKATREGVSWLGAFYAANIAGGVAGSLLAGFYLLRVYDAAVATYLSAAMNAAVALAAWALAGQTPHDAAATSGAPPERARAWPVHVSIALSGATALAAEVIWARLLSLHFGATVYTLALIVAVFLAGLGLGSGIGARLARGLAAPGRALGWCQLLLCGAMAWAAYALTESLPYWRAVPYLTTSAWLAFLVDLARCLWVVLPATLLWGASFPLALAAVTSPDRDAARLAGGIYASNTVGAIVGSLLTTFLLVPWIGSTHTEQLMIAASACSALLMLVRPTAGERWTPAAAMVLAGAAILGGLSAWSVHKLPGLLVAYGRFASTRVGEAEFIYVGEGINASVAVSQLPGGVLNYHNAGKVQASSEPQDMRLQRMLGHLTTLVPAHPRRVLVIGCGAGVTAGAVSIDPAVESETIVEIEPLVPEVVSTYFADYNFDVIRNPKVRVQIDDARHFVETTRETFDAVTSDPLDPWVKGAAMLYTAEFFEMLKRHLNRGGVVTLFVQLYESNTESVKSEIGTFLQAFPNGVVWGNTNEGEGYDLVLLGQVEPARIDVDDIDARLRRPEYAWVAQSLREIRMQTAVDLFSTYAGRKPDLDPWLRDAAINRDRNLRLQYLAGLGLNLYRADVIYTELLSNVSRLPEDLFQGSDETKRRLFAAIRAAQGR